MSTELTHASFWGQVVDVSMLLARQDIDVNEVDDYGRTPLQLASIRGHTRIISMLLDKRGIDVNKADDEGRTPLWRATQNGHADVVKLLLAKEGVDVNQANKHGAAPLYVASEKGDTEIVKLLLRWRSPNGQANPRVEVNQAKDGGFTPLYIASEKGWKNIVQALLAAGASEEADSRTEFTPVYIALKKNHEDIAQLIIDKWPLSDDRRAELFWIASREKEIAIANRFDSVGTIHDGTLTLNKSVSGHRYKNRPDIRRVVVTNAVEYIGTYAFKECHNLASVALNSNSLTTIFSGSFKRCSSLTSVTFGDALQTILDAAFQGCNRLTSLYFPYTLKTIGQQAFESCTELTTTFFPANLGLNIGPRAFHECLNLETVDLPDSVKFGKDSFPRKALPPDKQPGLFDVATKPHRLAKGSRLYSIIGYEQYEGRPINFFCRNVQLCSRAAQDDGYIHIFECRESLKLLSANSWRHKMFDHYVEYMELENILKEYCAEHGLDGWYLRCYTDNRIDEGASCPLGKADYEVAILGTSFQKLNHLGYKPATRHNMREVKHLRRQKKKGTDPQFKTWVDVRGKRKLG